MIDVSHHESHRPALVEIVQRLGLYYGAELGLGGGNLSRLLLSECPDLTLIGVDSMRRRDRARACRDLRSQYGGRYRLLEMKTRDAAQYVDEGALDFVFIDAGHSFEAVHDDIRRWHGKVRPGGWIMGHDYAHPRYDGVQKAVDRWFGDRVYLPGHTIWAVQQTPTFTKPTV